MSTDPSPDQIWFYHLTLILLGGVLSLAFLYVWYKREEERAQKYFDAQHGEQIFFPELQGESAFFLACLIVLERARIEKKRVAVPVVPVVHAIGPNLTLWACGASTKDCRVFVAPDLMGED